MERIRIDRRDLSLRARHRASRTSAAADAAAPLQYTSGGGAAPDDDLLARIDVVLAGDPQGSVTPA